MLLIAYFSRETRAEVTPIEDTGMTAPLRIALLGAPGTGKTQLAGDLAAALSGGEQPLLIADNPPWAMAQPAARQLTLLMGLDLAATDAAGPERDAADQALRQTLTQAGVRYTVIYGQGPERLHNALLALQSLLPGKPSGPSSRLSTPQRQPPWVWSCDKCSDPQCERRLLSDLLASRAS